ncbi:MAG: T9SS type A sorting domain-containing protein [Candidatus Fermentibacteraceae bacterium]|nr:T9SS type A sorting domain-containing protein [Candidatus Fermentibacteraceae bacterium]
MRYRNSSLMLLVMTTLLFTSVSQAMDPPAKMWEKWYYSTWDYAYFKDIELNQNGDFFVTCLVWSYTQPALENYVALLLDGNGNKIWDVPHEYYGEAGYDGIALSDGSYIITGSATEDSTSNSIGLCIHKIASDGSTEWSKIYDYPGTKEEGYGITCLPDGGFAVCGRVHGTGSSAGQAWLLRTDAQGDTLWTRTWGTGNRSYAKSVVFNNNELCVLTQAVDDTLSGVHGPHLLFFDINGNYIRGVGFGTLFGHEPASLCIASDGGYTFVSHLMSSIWHTDQYGATVWWHNIPTDPMAVHEGFCVRRTMDSGYIFSGWTGYWTGPGPNNPNAPVLLVDTGNTQDAWLARYSEEGEYLWGITEERGVDYHFYSVAQLPEGGYVACGTWFGQGGYLARFAPETGIEVEEPSPVITLDMFPNPFSSVLSVAFNLPESGEASVLVYDLSGRLIDTVADELFPAGENTVQWTVPGGVSSGCYLIRYNTGSESDVETVVLLK